MTSNFPSRIRKFNPGTVQSDAEVTEQFVVRTDALDEVLTLLRGETSASQPDSQPTPPHILVTGRRGYGKTMLLARVAADIRAVDSERLLPVRFMEENYEIFTLADFWLEVLLHLAHELSARDPARSETLLRVHADLAESWHDADIAARAAYEVRYAAGDLTLVVMLENLQDLCATADPEFERGLRDALLTQPHLRLLATAINPFAFHSSDADAPPSVELPWSLERSPLYSLFSLVDLKPLDLRSSQRLWTRLTRTPAPPEAVRPLHILTGGNPRLIVMLAGLAGDRSLARLIDDLVSLVDDHTDYFRDHLDSLAKTERRVYIAVIALWKPSITREISERARIDPRIVSAMLARLVSRGLIVKTLGKGRLLYYHAAEGFLFNVYYNLRHDHDATFLLRAGAGSSHAGAGAGDTLVRFMAAFYSAADESEVHEGLLAEAERESLGFINSPPSELPSALPSLDPVAAPPDSATIEAEALASTARAAGTPEEAEVIYEDLLRRFSDSASPGVVSLRFEAYWYCRDRKENRVDMSQLFGNSIVPSIQSIVAEARVRKSNRVSERRPLTLGWRLALRGLNAVIRDYGDSTDPTVQAWVVEALKSVVFLYIDMGRWRQEMRERRRIVKLFGDRTEPILVEAVHWALGITMTMRPNWSPHFSFYRKAKYMLWAVDEVVRRSDIGEIPVLAGLYALKEKYRAQAKKGDYKGAARTCDVQLERTRRYAGDSASFLTADALYNRGIYEARTGKLDNAIASWEALRGTKVAKSEVDFWDTRARRMIVAAKLAMGHVNEAWRIYDRTDGAPDFWGATRMLWARLRGKANDRQEARRRVEHAVREFRAAYAQLEPESDKMIRVILPPVMELIAVGASERDVLAILTADSRKAAELLPMVVALQQRVGATVGRQPAEVMAVAADVRRRIEERVEERTGSGRMTFRQGYVARDAQAVTRHPPCKATGRQKPGLTRWGAGNGLTGSRTGGPERSD